MFPKSLLYFVPLGGLAIGASAQAGGTQYTNDFRSKYGPALPRETFLAKPGIEMVVHFAANGHVCKIELPPTGPVAVNGAWSNRAVDDLVAELVPLRSRGRELSQMAQVFSLQSISTVEFENVSISESFQGTDRTRVTIAFAKEVCQD
jgi:hypothetical protein